MKRDNWARLLLALLVVAVVWGGCTAIQALERARMTNRQALEALRAAEQRLARSAAPAAPATSAVPAASGEVANARFYLPGARPGGSLRECISAEPPSLNPIITNESTCSELYSLCSAPLGEREYDAPDGDFKPLLAESWEISPDHLSYHIRLRRGAMWDAYTDPVSGRAVPAKEVTAEDFRFFVEVVKDPAVDCAPLRSYYQDLDTLEVIGPYEFVVKWKKPFYGSRAATLGMTPLPRHYYHDYPGKFDGKRFNDDHRRNAFIVGCGPYRFERWERNRRLVFRRNPDYFGIRLGAAPALETMVFEVIRLPNTRFQALAAGKLDMLGLSPEQWVRHGNDKIFTSGEFRKIKYPAPAYSYIGYNQKSPLFRDRRVRLALTMLVDRERIIRDVLHGLAIPIKSPFPPMSKYGDPEIKPWPYDPEQAKKLLAEVGWKDSDGDGVLDKDGQRFSFTMLQIANHPTQTRIFPLLKESFGSAGIEMKIQTLEWSVYIERLEQRNYEACSLGWTVDPDPDPYQVWHSQGIPSPGSNHIGYANAELDALIEQLRSEFDPDKRIQLTRRIERIIHEDQPYTFLYTSYALVAVSRKYDNVRVFPGGVVPRFFVER